MYDLVVIGAGPGGYEAAAHAGRMGKKVALVEKGALGGTCLNEGCIPTKTLLRSSKLLSEIRQAAKYGIRVSGPEFDPSVVLERKTKIVGTLRRGVESLLKKSNVEVIQATGRLASSSAVEADGRKLETKNILVATGSEPAVPLIPGIDSPAVLDSTSILELREIPRRLAIIGAGYIGLEFASYFAAVGAEVAMFEMLPQVAAGCDEDVSKRLLQETRKSGVQVNLSCRVSRISGVAVEYAGADNQTLSYEADAVLNATGRTPRIAGLGLEETGVDCSARGIRTSERGRTNIPGVWACGDATGRMLLAHAATREGLVAVNNMFGHDDRLRYEAIPAVIYTHPEAAGVGATEQKLRDQGVGYRKSLIPMAMAGRFLIEHDGGSGFVKALVGARYGQILGVHAVGDGASEFIMAAASFIESEMRVADVREIVFPHPTVSEALKEAIVQAGRQGSAEHAGV